MSLDSRLQIDCMCSFRLRSRNQDISEKTLEKGKLRKVVIRRNELPELEHAFLEGIELSISEKSDHRMTSNESNTNASNGLLQ